ncbi:glycosyltransferase family A protein [uncultured Desulfuromonas sp.]|uniref:glycosyltransferase family A protein n=1 Tax=uncultured Desulfuromonas sp. TaxID=181013 RepID=UPI002AAAD4E4|nr:glycosyltransferase family A protein [uncultured Desulfuromonas sp.]
MLETFKRSILHGAYRLAPFDVRGDAWSVVQPTEKIVFSCVINFYGRLDLLGGILHSLSQQDYPRDSFEVVLVEDQGGTAEGKSFCESFSDRLNIIYTPLDKNFSHMGYSRNFALARARGQFVLFLDDDTVLLQSDFLSLLVQGFERHPEGDALLPLGKAAFCQWPDKYDFHDPHFPTSRCTAYRRQVLEELGGFMSEFVGQEDVEFVLRFTLMGKKAVAFPCLEYFHPPLLVPNLKKPAAVGVSFSRLRGRYSTLMLWLAGLNCARHAPLLLSPKRYQREMGRFGCGFLLGFLKGWFRPDAQARYG